MPEKTSKEIERRNEELKALSESYGWDCIKKVLHKRIASHYEELLSCPMEKVNYHRAMVEADKRLLTLSEDLIRLMNAGGGE